MKLKLAAMALALTAGCASPGNSEKIIAREMKFEPQEIHAAKGVLLRVTLENRGTVLHDWNVSGLKAENPAGPAAGHSGHLDHGHPSEGASAAGLHAMAEPGQSSALSFKPLESGRFEFYCSVPGHREAGMKGILIVH